MAAVRAAMPEATVHKDAEAPRGENQVWPAGKSVAVKPIAQPGGMEMAAHGKLRSRILAVDRRHDLAAAGGSYRVHGNLGADGAKGRARCIIAVSEAFRGRETHGTRWAIRPVQGRGAA
jgi:hypothetical protein